MHNQHSIYKKINKNISFTVIIPVYKNGDLLKQCLHAVEKAISNTKYHTEVITVDDCSPNNTEIKDIVLSFKYAYIELKEHAGPAKARNYGAKIAKNNILVFIDSDVLVDINHFNVLGDFFEYQDKYIATIGLYNPNTKYLNFYSTFKNIQHYYTHKTSKSDTSIFFTGCGAIYKKVFFELKGFDTSYKDALIEDVDLGCRLTQQGYKVFLNKKLLVTHLKTYSLSSLFISDVFYRAIPLTVMLFKYKHVENDQDIKLEAIFSTCLIVVSLFVFALLLPSNITAILFIPTILIGVGVLNIGFIRFISKQIGYVFAIKALFYLCFYYLYCGFGLVLGIILFLIKKITNEEY